MNSMIASHMFFTRGVGRHRNNLESFELALRNAGIEQFNLVKVSSIFPPGCKIISRKDGLKRMHPGQIVFCVMAEARTDEPNRLCSAGIGLAVPARGEQYGYISEHHGYGMTEKKCADYVEDMAASMLATTLNIKFDPNDNYDSRREVYKMSGEIVKTQAFVQTAEGDKDGLWTTTVAAAILIFDHGNK
ncbi:MAG: arginine decarboxylase, pyruvoyl-dependent [Phycisphaerae bacterium]|nr:arginine decarboxylase, pyruvoyl-dependent [Phycisphaerae bacterium]